MQAARCVHYIVKLILVSMLLPAAMLAQTGIFARLKQVERRYNSPKTMQMLFEQTLTGPGRIGTRESGVLYLHKPGRMRWDYHKPEGKLFLADGKFVYFYNPATNQVERTKEKESADFRAFLAFLMGRLDFQRDFKQFTSHAEGQDLYVEALPKSDKASYRQVEFRLTPDNEITFLKVVGLDESVNQFRLTEQRTNPPLPDSLFEFKLPQGAEIVDVEEETGGL